MLLETVTLQSMKGPFKCFIQSMKPGNLFPGIFYPFTLAFSLIALPLTAISSPESTGTDSPTNIMGRHPSTVIIQQDTLQNNTSIELWDCFEILPPFDVTNGNESFTIDFKDLKAVKNHIKEMDPTINQVQFVFPITLEFPTSEVLEIFSLKQLQSLYDECQSE